MKNSTGKPFAFAEIDPEDGYWVIYFDPGRKLDGYFYYEQLRGPIDGSNADLIVNLLNSSHDKNDRLAAKLDIAKKALEFYAINKGLRINHKTNAFESSDSDILDFHGATARQALDEINKDGGV